MNSFGNFISNKIVNSAGLCVLNAYAQVKYLNKKKIQ